MGKQWNSVRLYFLGSKITADGDCSHEIKRRLLLGRKIYDKHGLHIKKKSEKVGLKHNIQKTKILASDPITSWQINGETMETLRNFILGGPKLLQMVTAVMKLKDAFSLEEKL